MKREVFFLFGDGDWRRRVLESMFGRHVGGRIQLRDLSFLLAVCAGPAGSCFWCKLFFLWWSMDIERIKTRFIQLLFALK